MTAKKKKPTDNDLLREQLHEVVRDLRSLQEEFQRARETQIQVSQAPCDAKSATKPLSLIRLVDDLDIAVDSIQASVTRLETRVLPLLPGEQHVVTNTNIGFEQLAQASDTSVTSQLLLSIAHLRILAAIIDELTENISI